MAEYNHIDYMKSVAEKLKEIGHTDQKPHFYRISGLLMLEEFLDKITSVDSGFHLLAEEDLTGQLSGVDNPLDNENYLFFIVKHVDLNDHANRVKIKRDCKNIAKKIIARIRKHWHAANAAIEINDTYGLRNFNTENIFYQTIGPIGDNCYGIEVRFSIIEKAGTIYNINDWNE
jgi:hypothetical protein